MAREFHVSWDEIMLLSSDEKLNATKKALLVNTM
jgi:hypothetical protein